MVDAIPSGVAFAQSQVGQSNGRFTSADRARIRDCLCGRGRKNSKSRLAARRAPRLGPYARRRDAHWRHRSYPRALGTGRVFKSFGISTLTVSSKSATKKPGRRRGYYGTQWHPEIHRSHAGLGPPEWVRRP